MSGQNSIQKKLSSFNRENGTQVKYYHILVQSKKNVNAPYALQHDGFIFSVDKGEKKAYLGLDNLDIFPKLLDYFETKNFYEVIRGDAGGYHPFVDIDYKYNDDSSTETVYNEFIEAYEEFMEQTYNYTNPDIKITVSNRDEIDSNGYKKISLHVVDKGAKFEEIEQLLIFHTMFHSYCVNVKNQPKICDRASAQRNKNMRTIYSSKYGQNRPLLPYDDDNPQIMDYMILNVNQDAQTISTIPPVSSKREDNGEIDRETPEYEKFWDYAKLIDITPYETWLAFSMAHKNVLGVTDVDAWDEYCATFPGYDPRSNIDNYDNFSDDRGYGMKKIYDMAYASDPRGKKECDVKWAKKEPEKKSTDRFSWKIIHDLPDTIDLVEFRIKKAILFENYRNEVEESQRNAIQRDIKALDKVICDTETQEMFNYFDKYHFKICAPKPTYGCVMYDDLGVETINWLKPTDMLNLYVNIEHPNGRDSFIKSWMKRKEILTYDRFDMYPNPAKCPENIYNVFDGWYHSKIQTIEPNREGLKYALKIRSHLMNNSLECINYFDNWVARIIQTPWNPPRTAIIIKSDEGCGKGSFFRLLTEIMGKKYTVSTSKLKVLFGDFNDSVANKFLVLADEVSPKDAKDYEENIKTIITENTININAKNKDPATYNNYCSLIIATNKTNPARISATDRRFFMVESNSINNYREDMNTYIRESIHQDKIASCAHELYNYYMNFNITVSNFELERPLTQTYIDTRNNQIPRIFLFIRDFLEQRIGDTIEINNWAQLWDEYKSWHISEFNEQVRGQFCSKGKLKAKVCEFFGSGAFQEKRTKNSRSIKIDPIKLTDKLKEKFPGFMSHVDTCKGDTEAIQEVYSSKSTKNRRLARKL